MMESHNSSGGGGTSDPETKRAASPAPSGASLKSDWSMEQPIRFSSGTESSQRRQHSTGAAPHTYTLVERTGDLQQDSYTPVDDDLYRVLEKHKTNMKNKYKSLFEGIKTHEKTLLNRIYTQLYIIEGESEGVNKEHEVLQMEKTPRKQNLHNTEINCLDIFKHVQGSEGELEDEMFRHALSEESEEDKRVNDPKFRTVLTKGIAGIGKTVSVQKFILDWAEGKANQDIDFIILLPFRELNLIKDEQCIFHDLLCNFCPELKDLQLKIYDVCKVVVIFDGLDESKIQLNFLSCNKVSDISMTSSVGELMSKLIKGDLLPSAFIWITSRPAAANQIPPQYINRVTEIQGFNDPQKEQYFRKRISDQDQATKIISHIKTQRSLHIMCHISVFCWISATVLQEIIKQANQTEIPKTLTEMYIHFLLIQTKMTQQKYYEKDATEQQKLKLFRKIQGKNKLWESDRHTILKLAELAFKQLMKCNVMFYEEDLRECSIDVTEASVYSGICTEIFRDESVLYQRKVYCFVHLSFQEFLAAFYVFYCYASNNFEALQILAPLKKWHTNVSLHDLLVEAVDKSLQSQNGHLDLFLRFLHGISLQSNQKFLAGLLPDIQGRSDSVRRTIKYIQKLIKGSNMRHVEESYKSKWIKTEAKEKTRSFTSERSINLVLCLTEMKDQSLFREIQENLKSDKQPETWLSPAYCSAIAYMLLISEEVIDDLDLKKYNTSDEGYRRLIPAVSNSRRALLAGCNLTMKSFETLCSTLKPVKSYLTELDLSNNSIYLTIILSNSIKILSSVLKSSSCKLEILRLSGCWIAEKEKGCSSLASALNSNPSHLNELDLSYNHLADSGVKLLYDMLENPQCNLETLRLVLVNITVESCKSLTLALQSGYIKLKELDLSSNDMEDSGVKLLSDGLKNCHCKLEILRLSGCLVTEEGCSSLASALSSNPSHLKELDLTYNHPGESGEKLLFARLLDPHCKLETLQLENSGKTRIKKGLRKYACVLTLDPNTAHTLLSLSEGNRKVMCVREQQSYPDHPERFDGWLQVMCRESVLSRESVCGRCYWEAEWSGGGAAIAVTYKGISRKGFSGDSFLGKQEKSWKLNCYGNSYCAWHNNKRTVIPALVPSSNRVGVYLDWLSGTLSFYSVSSDTHTLTHLYTFHSTFTEPLYAGFGVWYEDSSISIIDREL